MAIRSCAQGFADLPWVLTDYHLPMLPANEDGTIEGVTAAAGRGISNLHGLNERLHKIPLE